MSKITLTDQGNKILDVELPPKKCVCTKCGYERDIWSASVCHNCFGEWMVQNFGTLVPITEAPDNETK